MKRISMLTVLGGLAILIAGALMISSCEGPVGPAGTDGADGINGVDGAPGQDANSTCIECHSNDQLIVAKTRQYANSGHSTGHTAGYTNRSFGPLYNCASCHTSQGFIDNLVGASNVPYADVTQPNCYTCHNIHDTYTEADWALTNGGIPAPATGSTSVDIGTGNQCSACHQMVGYYLAVDSLWSNFDDGGLTTVTIASSQSRVGIHHGPQYNLLVGMDLFEFTGAADDPMKDHVLEQVDDGCVTCHMNDGFGDLTGHSMAMTWEYHGSETYNWPESCQTCHPVAPYQPNPLDAKAAAISLEVDGLMTQLYDLLVTAGIMYPEGTSDEYLIMPGATTTDLVAAHVNYNAVREDRSAGFHNPGYIRVVLANTIAAITP